MNINSFGNSSSNSYIGYPINNVTDLANYKSAINSSIPASSVSYKRRMMRWLVPEIGIVDMYINPQSLKIQHKKTIRAERTKGGFVIQYWGEELPTMQISGHTGSSGFEGINVLENIYRGEQLAFDAIAIQELIKYQNEDEEAVRALIPGVGQVFDFMKGLTNPNYNAGLSLPKPTLGAFASSIEMYYMGIAYRGFFTDFSVDESVNKLGMFDYNISFTITQKRGYRRNSLPWQHTATAGPSDHSIIPYTFDGTTPINKQKNLVEEYNA